MHMKKTVLVVFMILIAGVTTSVAQVEDAAEKALVERANKLLDSSMTAINFRAQRFNEEMTRVNQLKPFDSTSLTAEKIKANRVGLKDFLSYLEVYRSVSTRYMQEVDDSIKAIRSAAPSTVRETYLMEFQQAFHKDQETFNKFTVALTAVWKKIDEVLEYIQTAKMELHGGRMQFSSEDELKKYNTFMEEVTKLNKKASSAGTASSKAAFEASQAMNEAYGVGPKK